MQEPAGGERIVNTAPPVSTTTSARARIRESVARLHDPWFRVVAWVERRDWDEGAVLMAFAVVIGMAAGGGVILFYQLIDLAYFVFITWLGSRLDVGAHMSYRPVLTAAGLWAAWALVRRARIPDGQNIPALQLAVAKGGGIVKGRPVAVRTVASAITLGSGGSAGSEGPVAVLGAAVGSALGRAFRFTPRRIKILVGCGTAAGISAAFNAPIAGAFFALETVLGTFSAGAFSPVIIASVTGALVVRPFLGSHPAFTLPSYGEPEPLVVGLLFPLLGVACGLFSALYTWLYFRASDALQRSRLPAGVRPVAGGFAVGLIVLASGGLLVGNGHVSIPVEVFGGVAWYVLVALAVGKVVATVITLNYGGSGGLFTPTLFIGAALGGGLGTLMRDLLPRAGIHPEAWGVVGMAGLVSGATRTPITAILIIFEMTDDYTLILPLMMVSVIAYSIARALSRDGLNEGWLTRRGEHIVHGADRAIMERVTVSEAFSPSAVTVPPQARLGDVIRAAGETSATTLPVVDSDGGLLGVITYEDLRAAMLDRGDLAGLLVAADLAEPSEVITPRDSLREALRVMNVRAIDALPVVVASSGDSDGGGADAPQYLGILTRAGLLAAYERRLLQEV